MNLSRSNHFEWFKILVDSYPERAMANLKNVEQWQALCQQQFETEDYTRWYNTVKFWYKENCNTKYNHNHMIAYFEKIYYMHKSKLIVSFIRVRVVFQYHM